MGNRIGKTLLVDQSYKFHAESTLAKVLVSVELSLGLPDFIEIILGDFRFLQVLDYINIPLRCGRFNVYGDSIRSVFCHLLRSSGSKRMFMEL